MPFDSIHTTPTAQRVIILDTVTPEGRAALKRMMVMLGGGGRDIDQAKAGVRHYLAMYRREQAFVRRLLSLHCSPDRIPARLPQMRANVRRSIAAARVVMARVEAQAVAS